jgi:hypothetical protein
MPDNVEDAPPRSSGATAENKRSQSVGIMVQSSADHIIRDVPKTLVDISLSYLKKLQEFLNDP